MAPSRADGALGQPLLLDSEVGEYDDSPASFSVENSVHGNDSEPGTPRLISATQGHLSTIRLFGINAFTFAYGLFIATYAIILLPSEALRFCPETRIFMLAGLLILAGVSQLSGPIAGFFSDRCRSKYGRRRPVILIGGLVVLPSLLLQWLSRVYVDSQWALSGYVIGYFVAMLALNCMFTAAAGIYPDTLPEDQMGKANGIFAALMAAGATSGFVYTFILPDTGKLYPFFVVLLIVSTALTLLSTPEKPWLDPPAPWTWRDIWECYKLDRKLYPDFWWLLMCRICYYGGVSVQVFLQYYFRDTVYKNGVRLVGHQAEKYTADVAFLGQLFGAIGAYPAGAVSDRVGRKTMILIACTGIIGVYIGFMFTHELNHVLSLGAVYGFFNGVYLSVDYALAIACLPDNEDSAKWLSIWSVGAFIGATVGPAVNAPVFYFGNKGRDDDHQLLGYQLIMTVGSVWMILSAILLKFIHPERAKAAREAKTALNEARQMHNNPASLLSED